MLGLSDGNFGLWASTAVNDTSQVVAVSAMYSDQAQNVATIIKLTRNVLMSPLIFLIGVVYQRAKSQWGDQSDPARPRFSVKKAIPGFVIGFVFMALVRTVGIALGVLPQHVATSGHLHAAAQWLISVDGISKFSILMALSAVGLNTGFSNLRRIGFKPLLVGTIVAVALSVTSLVLILFTPFGG